MMKHLGIKNFGPIKDGFPDGLMPIYPITIICGDQGTGKSTIAKLISLFNWMEKAFVRGEFLVNKITEKEAFLKKQCEFHRINNYFRPDTYLHFQGEQYDFFYQNGQFTIQQKNEGEEYLMPKIAYIPAERSFLSVVEHPEILKEIPESLFSHFSEFDKARKENRQLCPLPIEGYYYQYDRLNNASWLVGDSFRVKVSESASGFQSMIPLCLVSQYTTDLINSKSGSQLSLFALNKIEKRAEEILADDTINEETRKLLISRLSKLNRYNRSVIIIEEPEQNLFPLSQKDVLFFLFKQFNNGKSNNLVITTHSPYLIDYTTLAIKAKKIVDSNPDLDNKVDSIVPKPSRINGNQVCVYQVENGRIIPLNTYDDMPSDNNFLNQELNNTNKLFSQLLEMEP